MMLELGMGPRQPASPGSAVCRREDDVGEGFERGDLLKESFADQAGLDEAGQHITGEHQEAGQCLLLVAVGQYAEAVGSIRVNEGARLYWNWGELRRCKGGEGVTAPGDEEALALVDGLEEVVPPGAGIVQINRYGFTRRFTHGAK